MHKFKTDAVFIGEKKWGQISNWFFDVTSEGLEKVKEEINPLEKGWGFFPRSPFLLTSKNQTCQINLKFVTIFFANKDSIFKPRCFSVTAKRQKINKSYL